MYKSEDILFTVYQGKPKMNALLLSMLPQQTTATYQCCHSRQPKENTLNCQVLQRNKVWCGCGTPNGLQVHCQDNKKVPVHSFQNILDLAAINAWVLHKEINSIKIPKS